MKTVTIMVSYPVLKTLVRAVESHLKVSAEDEDARHIRQLLIETGAIMEIEAMMDLLLEDEGIKEDCKGCPAKETCRPPDPKVN